MWIRLKPYGASKLVRGYTLVICEKPDAAKKISDALSRGTFRSEQVEGTAVYRFRRGEDDFVVCSAQGHVYGVSDPSDERVVYPVFDVEWYSSDLIGEDSRVAQKRIAAVRKMAGGASRFVNACDFDVEGETIAFNLLRYACGGKEKGALRAKFSTLTEGDIVEAFENLNPEAGDGLARAGRARHTIDFVWGVNLSRALSQAALGFGHKYRTVSVGRVQSPTLGFLVEREQEIREFVPVPYWRVSGIFEHDGKRFNAEYIDKKVETKSLAERIRGDCSGRRGVVKSVRRSLASIGPPVPLNIGDLQKEAYRTHGYSPSRTLMIAEKLYLAALISYPRTGSQRLPNSINYRRVLVGIEKIPAYSAHVTEILKGEPKPVQGAKSDPAHPAIYPTGEVPRRALDASEAFVFDLVVRRFLAAFGPSAKQELVSTRLVVDEYEFGLEGARTVSPGWMEYYEKHASLRDIEITPMSEGDSFRVVSIQVDEKFKQRPSRYNQGSLLEKMEKEGIGTKATRADIIATLARRGYVIGEDMEVTDLGLSVAETMAKYNPSIISTKLTRRIEEKLEAIEAGTEAEAMLLRETVRSLSGQLLELNANERVVGQEIDSSLARTIAKSVVLGRCPVCKTGELRVVKSKATKKRFVGCSNYPAGCRASAPLPQKGTIRVATSKCARCSWPIIYVLGGRHPWRLCVNPDCPGKSKP